ncbi:M20 family metallopeptidase [Brevibacillus panacihumi]|uniref:M20 family metallopeptidase n=1 Tax=Paenibacillaceae TaxID=186822 RepID=UPI003D02A923
MSKVLAYLNENIAQILSDLERLVKAESPSKDKVLTDHCGEELKDLFKLRLGLEAEVIPQSIVGNFLKFTFGSGDSQILIISHYDTVWDAGRLPYRVDGNKVYGPGILDMKGGIIQSLWALKACQELGIFLDKKIVFLCISDHEGLGSRYSRPLIEQEASRSAVVLVPEPAEAITGALKTSRKGILRFVIKIQGIAAHAGNNPQDGVSAIEEMAYQILYLRSLTNKSRGTTVNVGIVKGGNQLNVVPDQAEIHIDIRVTSMQEAERVSGLIQGVKPNLKGISLQVEGGIARPTMERTSETERLFRVAQLCGQEFGVTLNETAAGGGSDGSFAAYLGIPTLDGLGSVGEGPHAEYEHILIDQLPLRAALFSELLTRL